MNYKPEQKVYIVITILISRTLGDLYSSGSNVIGLDSSNFEDLVINSHEVWIVEFYVPWCGYCQRFAPEYQKAANALKGVIKVGAVNIDNQKDLGGRFGVQSFPTVKIFGENKKNPIDYNGERTSQSLVDKALMVAQSKVHGRLGEPMKGREVENVVKLTDDNFDNLVLKSDHVWLVEFFAPWCGHCKNLEPHWTRAATELKGKMKLGALDATVHSLKANQYEIRGYPTIKYFGSGVVEDYNGGRATKDIVNWAMEKLEDKMPAPEILQILNQRSFDNDCQEKPICVVAVLPYILDCQSECRQGYLDVLRRISEKYKTKRWGWAWSEAGAQPELENSLDIGGFGYPAMVAINPKKMKYSLLRGSFSKNGISEFLRDLSYGRGSTNSIKDFSLPTIVETAPWDQKDVEIPFQEELDLSDVDLEDLKVNDEL